MNAADAILLGLIALGDLTLIFYLRNRRSLQKRSNRMMASLALAVRRETAAMTTPAGRPVLRRAS